MLSDLGAHNRAFRSISPGPLTLGIGLPAPSLAERSVTAVDIPLGGRCPRSLPAAIHAGHDARRGPVAFVESPELLCPTSTRLRTRPVIGRRQPAVLRPPGANRVEDTFARPTRLDRTRMARRRGTTSARCPCGSFSDAALPNPAGPFPITGLSSDYVVIVVGCSITENIQDRFGALHYAYLAALRCPATCAPSPCGRLSRPPRWVVAPTTTMGTPSPWGSRPEG